jgi:beta-galactosidase
MYPKVEYLDKLGNHEEIKITLVDNILNKLAAVNKPLKPEQYAGKPVVLCEYAHAMENSLGNFQEYMDRFEKYKNMAGGFIWDFVDQSIRQVDKNGTEKWLYGGDFGEEDTHRYFCANGIVFADRSLHPSIFEVKKVYQEIKVQAVDLLKGKIKIQNKYSFSDLSDFEMVWEVSEDGSIIETGVIENIEVGPKEIKEYRINYTTPKLKVGSEYYLTISFRIKSDKRWAQRGFEAAWDQFRLPFDTGKTTAENNTVNGIFMINSDQKQIEIKGNGFTAVIGKLSGGLESLDYDFGETVTSPLAPNYWRTLTDNDMGYANFEPKLEGVLVDRSWEKATKNRKVKEVKIEKQNDYVKIIVVQSVANTTGDTITVYNVDINGVINVEHSIVPKKDMYRVGMQMKLPKEYDNVTWYGRGPHETYEDRKTGAKIGIYSSNVKKLVHNYMRPQENGNRTDVRWVEIRNSNGQGLRFETGTVLGSNSSSSPFAVDSSPIEQNSGTGFNFSAWPYSMEDLDAAKHIHELPKRDYITLNIDHRQNGVGGDLPGVAGVHDAYRIYKNKTHKYSFTIRRID